MSLARSRRVCYLPQAGYKQPLPAPTWTSTTDPSPHAINLDSGAQPCRVMGEAFISVRASSWGRSTME
jgi:hypothetical protein